MTVPGVTARDPACSVLVLASPHPLKSQLVEFDAEPGKTIAELIAAAGIKPARVGNVRVFVIDRAMSRELVVIPRDQWAYTRPKPGMLVSIKVVPTGGGGGGKNPLRTVLQIAVMAAAFIAPEVLPAWGKIGTLGGLLKSPLHLSTLVYAAATSIAGPAVVNANQPPPGAP